MLVRALSDADRLIGRLAGEGRRLPNPHLLIRPFVRREAVLSSRIEGTQATLGELLAAEAGAAVDRRPADLREVANYVVALEHGVKRLKTLPLSLRLTRELHAKLMTGVRGGYATPGEFRKTQNWIGPPGCTLANASYVPPPPDALMGCLGAWEKFLHDRSLPALVQAALMHVQFEAIHPFVDGNGRVGRLLITLFLVERGVLPAPLLYLSAFFEATRADYYEAAARAAAGASEEQRRSRAKQVSNWLLGDLSRLLNAAGIDITKARARPEQLASLVVMVEEGTISGTAAKEVLGVLFESGRDPADIVRERGLGRIEDGNVVADAVRSVIASNGKAVADYRAGKAEAVKYLVGQVMKETRGRADAARVREMLEAQLAESS